MLISLIFLKQSRLQTQWKFTCLSSCGFRMILCRLAGKTQWFPNTHFLNQTFIGTLVSGIFQPAFQLVLRISRYGATCRDPQYFVQRYLCFISKLSKPTSSYSLPHELGYYIDYTALYSTKIKPASGWELTRNNGCHCRRHSHLPFKPMCSRRHRSYCYIICTCWA